MKRSTIRIMIGAVAFGLGFPAAADDCAVQFDQAIVMDSCTSTTAPTFAVNHTKLIVKEIDGRQVRFTTAFTSGTEGNFGFAIYRRIGDGRWNEMYATRGREVPNLLLDNADRLHAIYPDVATRIRHLRFDRPVTGAPPVVVPTDGIVGGARGNNYFGAALDVRGSAGGTGNGNIWLVFSDRDFTLRAALYTTGWNLAAELMEVDGWGFLYPSVVAHRGRVDVLVTRRVRPSSPVVWDNVCRFVRRPGDDWRVSEMILGAPDATGTAVFGSDLIRLDDAGNVAALIRSDPARGGPLPRGMYLVGPDEWVLTPENAADHLVPGTDRLGRNCTLAQDESGRLWLAGYGALSVEVRVRDGETWTSGTLPGKATGVATAKPKSGSDWLGGLHFVYSTGREGPGAWTTVAEGGAGFGCCPQDLDGSGHVDAADVSKLISAWGDCAACPEDMDADGTVGLTDLFDVLNDFGLCAR